MTSISPLQLAALPLVPLLTALLVLLAGGRRPLLRDLCALGGSLATFLVSLSLIPPLLRGGGGVCHLATLYPGISLRLQLDGLGLILALVSSTLWLCASPYCVGYLRALNEHAQTRFHVCYALAVGGGLGVALAGSLVTLYLFYELITLVTYPLVMHHQDDEGYAAGKKYLVYLMFTSKALLLPGLLLTYLLCGTLDFPAAGVLQGIFPAGADPLAVTVAYLCLLFGFAKSGIMPLHNWLPDAMVAPTPVSALLHAVVVVKVGVFAICRTMLSLFGVNLLQMSGLGLFTAYFVCVTILVASLLAFTTTNLKARLAYSTVSQLSYIVLGVAMLTPAAISGGLLHIACHAFAKISLFFAAGCIFVASGRREIPELAGIGRRMPVTMAAFGLASLGMVGVPPLSGFVSKWYLALGAMELHSVPILAVLLMSSLLNAGYFFPIVLTAFFDRPPEGEPEGSLERGALMPLLVAPPALTALASLLIGLWPGLLLRVARLMGGA